MGRISADRLGAALELSTQATSQPSVGLKVNWNEFEEPGRDLEGIDVKELEDSAFLVPTPSVWDPENERFGPAPDSVPNSEHRAGTELLIRDLRQSWELEDIQELRRLLSLLTAFSKRSRIFK